MKKIDVFRLLLFVPLISFSQANQHNNSNEPQILMQSLNASGADGLNDQGSISFSIGQTFYLQENEDEVNLLQGVQQSKIYKEIKTKNNPKKDIVIKAYPNPMVNHVVLSIPDYKEESYSYALYTLNGILLKAAPITGSKSTIPVEELPTSTYLLKVIDVDNTIQTLKLIKK